MHFSEIIKLQFGKKNAIHCFVFYCFFELLLLNPFSLDSAIWHKLQLHAQYSVNLREICTTKRS